MSLYFCVFCVLLTDIFENDFFVMCVIFGICLKVLGLPYVFENGEKCNFHRFICFCLRFQFCLKEWLKKKRAEFNLVLWVTKWWAV